MDYKLEDLKRMGWENPINFDKLQIGVTTFAIGYIHSNQKLSESNYIRFFLIILSVSFFLSVINYLLTQKELDDMIKKIRNNETIVDNKSLLHTIGLNIWWISGVSFAIAISGILILLLFN